VIGRLLKKGAQYLGLLSERNFFSLRATVQAVHRLTPTIVEVVIHAPFAARAFHPGQFYRLQNFESLAPLVKGTRLAMEGLALTGASVDREQGLLSTIVLEMGGSSDLCAYLKPGEPVVLMGPTGSPTEIPEKERYAGGGGLGNAVLFYWPSVRKGLSRCLLCRL
jgi:NAD(P)H-flavin reductase